MTSSAPTRESAGGIGVLEAEPFLAPELQRQFAGEEVTVRSFRLVSDLVAMACPRVFILSIEFEQDAVAEILEKAQHEPTTACVVIVRAGELSEFEWPLREIGAVSVMDHFVRGEQLAAICRMLLNSRITREHSPENHV